MSRLFATLCTFILIVYNGLLMIAGVIITARGVYYRSGAVEASYYWGSHLLGTDEFYRSVSVTYLLPGCVMIFLSSLGSYGAYKLKRDCLAFYFVLIIVLMCFNVYGLSARNSYEFSLHSYMNRVYITGDLELFNGIAYPEFIIQVALLISAAYLYYFIMVEKESERREMAEQIQRKRLLEAAAPSDEYYIYNKIYSIHDLDD